MLEIVRSFFVKIKSKVVLWIMQSQFYAWAMVNVIPFIRISFYYSRMRGKKYKSAYRTVLPGDILLTKDVWKLTNWLVPGKFSHACMCVDKGEFVDFEVASMNRGGYTKWAFYDVIRESTKVVILRCRDWDQEYTKKVVEKCKSFEGTPYDITFSLGIKTLYCSELIYVSDFEKRLKVSTEDLLGIGRPYISPYGLSLAENVDVIWDSDVV